MARFWKLHGMGQPAYQYWSQITLTVGISVLFFGMASRDWQVAGVGLVLTFIGFSLMLQVNFTNNPATPLQISHVDTTVYDPPLSLDLVLEEVRRSRDLQFSQIDGLDAKSGVVIGASGVILALLVAGLLQTPNTLLYPILFKFATIPIIIALIIAIISIPVRSWRHSPDLRRLRWHYILRPEEETKLAIIDTSIAAFEHNRRRINLTAFFLQIAYVFLGIGLGLLAVWIIRVVWK